MFDYLMLVRDLSVCLCKRNTRIFYSVLIYVETRVGMTIGIRCCCFNDIHVFLFAFRRAMSWCWMFLWFRIWRRFGLGFVIAIFLGNHSTSPSGDNQVDGLPPALIHCPPRLKENKFKETICTWSTQLKWNYTDATAQFVDIKQMTSSASNIPITKCEDTSETIT